MSAPKLLTVPEAAERLGMAVATLRRWVSRRRLAVVKFGRSARAAVRIEEAELERLIAEHRRPRIDALPGRRPWAGPGNRRGYWRS